MVSAKHSASLNMAEYSMNAKMIMSEYSQNSYFDMIRRRGVVRIYDLADRGNLSLYESLYRHIRDDILAGNLLPDDRLPSKRSLAADLGVSVITVEGAYRQLQAEGYIVSRERSGYYVRSIATRPHATRPVSSRAVTSRPTFAVAAFSSAPAFGRRRFATSSRMNPNRTCSRDSRPRARRG